jgi:hypothetical protein
MEKHLTIHEIIAALDRSDPLAFVPRTRPALADAVHGIPMEPPPSRPPSGRKREQLRPGAHGHLQLVRRAA